MLFDVQGLGTVFRICEDPPERQRSSLNSVVYVKTGKYINVLIAWPIWHFKNQHVLIIALRTILYLESSTLTLECGGADIAHNGRRLRESFENTLEGCISRCKANEDCKFISYRRSNKHCYLKNSLASNYACAWCDSNGYCAREGSCNIDNQYCSVNVYRNKGRASTVSSRAHCNNKQPCFCANENCLIGGDHKSGNVYVGGTPVCDDQWDFAEAKVFCKELGFSQAIASIKGSKFGEVPYSIYNTLYSIHIQCTGNETEFSNCTQNLNGRCYSRKGARVVCADSKLN